MLSGGLDAWCGGSSDCWLDVGKETEKVYSSLGYSVSLFLVFSFYPFLSLSISFLSSSTAIWLPCFTLLFSQLNSPLLPCLLFLHYLSLSPLLSFPPSLFNHPSRPPPSSSSSFLHHSLPRSPTRSHPFCLPPPFLPFDYTSGLVQPASSSYSIPPSHYVLCMCLCVIRHTRPGLSSLMNKLRHCVQAPGTRCSF